jgi:hypothetical protein
LQHNEVSQPSFDDQALYTYGVHDRVIVLILDLGGVAVVGVDRPSIGGLETALDEPSLDKLFGHRCEDLTEVMLQP